MALGSFTGTTNNRFITSKIEWSSTIDQLTNTSEVTASIYARKNSDSSSETTGDGTWCITIDGNETTFIKRVSLPANDTWVLIGTATATVQHDADGTKSIVISGTGGMRYTTWTTTSCTLTVTLDSIPRETTPTFDATSKDIGSTLQITFDRADPSFKHCISYIWNGETHRIAWDIETLYEWVIPMSFADDMTTVESATCYIMVETYNGDNALLGTVVSPITVRIPTSAVPTITAITCTDTGGQIPAAWGVFILGKSILHVHVDASGVLGSTITAYAITALGLTRASNDVNMGVVNYMGVNVSVIVTDSRGRTASETYVLDIIPYAPPEVTLHSCIRTNAQGTAVDNGTYAAITISSSISSIIAAGTQRNSMTLRIYHKRSDAETWQLARTILPNDTHLTEALYAIPDMVPSKSYAYRVEVSDAFGAVSIAETMLPVEGGLISWLDGGTGIAFGKVAEEANRAEFGWEIHARQGIASDIPLGVESGGTGATSPETARESLGAAAAGHTHALSSTSIVGSLPSDRLPRKYIIDMIYPIGAIFFSANDVNPSTFLGGTWIQIKDKFILAAGDEYNGGEEGGAASYELNVSHNHVSPIGYYGSAFGLVNLNGTSSDGNGDLYRSITATNTGSALTSNISMAKTKNTAIMATIPTLPPYLTVYVFQRVPDPVPDDYVA